MDPWQRWLVIHGGELLPDGRPRFRKLLVIVARQNGKTHVLMVLALYWLFVARVALVVGTSTNLDYARESWEKAVEYAEEIEELAEDLPRNAVRRTNGEQQLRTVHKSRYKIGASNRKGGRSLTINRLILDELREHDAWDAWNAAYNAMNAVRDGQAWAITNQGDEKAVVLASLHAEGTRFITEGEGDRRLGLFEWSAAKGARADDVEALAMANPNLNRRIDSEDLLADARRAMESGGEELAKFQTEIQCIKVDNLDPAIDFMAWKACEVPGDLSEVRARVAACLDVSLDGQHATLGAAALLEDGRVRVEPIWAWSGPDATKRMRAELPGHIARVRPYVLGWFPGGPAAAVAAELVKRPGWPPRGTKLAELQADAPAVCMGFAELVGAKQVAQADDPLFTAHVTGAEKSWQGDRWRFTRRGAGHCDAAYVVAGATHLVRTMPPPSKPVLVTGKRRAAA